MAHRHRFHSGIVVFRPGDCDELPGGMVGAFLAVLGILVGLMVAVGLVMVFVLLTEGLPG